MTELKVKRQQQVNSDDAFLADIITGLGAAGQKTLPRKYFYDERGAELFDAICRTEEYYPTRTELAILDQALPEIRTLIGADVDILEFGSGAGIKIRKLIEQLERPRSYIPIDISEEMLIYSAKALSDSYPELAIYPIVADYLSPIELPKSFTEQTQNRKLVFFPGSTISNFDPQAAISFIRHVRSLLEPDDVFLIGVDLVKPITILNAAYNDRQGLTAAFNLNILQRIKDLYPTDLDLANFAHHAFFNAEKNRIEMHLRSLKAQRVTIAGEHFNFSQHETIHTENSYKYTLASFRMIAENCGFHSVDYFTDEQNLFSLHYLTAK